MEILISVTIGLMIWACIIIYFIFLLAVSKLKKKMPEAAGVKLMYYIMISLAIFSILFALAERVTSALHWVSITATMVNLIALFIFAIGFVKFSRWVIDNKTV